MDHRSPHFVGPFDSIQVKQFTGNNPKQNQFNSIETNKDRDRLKGRGLKGQMGETEMDGLSLL